MSNRALSKRLASVKPGTAFVGVDLALDRNVAVVLTERAEQVSRFGFPNERDGYDYFYRRLDTIREQRQAPAVVAVPAESLSSAKVRSGGLRSEQAMSARWTLLAPIGSQVAAGEVAGTGSDSKPAPPLQRSASYGPQPRRVGDSAPGGVDELRRRAWVGRSGRLPRCQCRDLCEGRWITGSSTAMAAR